MKKKKNIEVILVNQILNPATISYLNDWILFTNMFCIVVGLLLCFILTFCYTPRASDFPREYDGACLQMRMSYSPAAHLFLFLVQWTDCRLAGTLGLLRILIHKVRIMDFICDMCWFCNMFPMWLFDTRQISKLPNSSWLGILWWKNNHDDSWNESQY